MSLSPLPTKVKGKAFISDDTWGLILYRKQIKTGISHIGLEVDQVTLAFCFQALRPSKCPALASTIDHLAIIRRDLILKRAVLVGIYKQVLVNVKRAIQADKVKFVDGLAARVERAVGIADLREVALALRCFRGSNSRRRANTHLKPMPALLLPSGTMAANFKEVRE